MANQRDPATDSAKQSAKQAAQAAGEAAHVKAQTLFDTNKQSVLSNTEGLTRALRSASEQMQGEHEPVARWVRRAADKLESVRRQLEQSDLDATIDSIEGYARREPTMFLGGTFLAGLAAARFFKASGERRRSERDGRRDFREPQLPTQRAMPLTRQDDTIIPVEIPH